MKVIEVAKSIGQQKLQTNNWLLVWSIAKLLYVFQARAKCF